MQAADEYTLQAFARIESGDWLARTYGGLVVDRVYRLEPQGSAYQLVLCERVALPAGALAWHWTVRALPPARDSLEGFLEVELRAVIGQVTISGERPTQPATRPEPEPPSGEAPEEPAEEPPEEEPL
jgi:hypothetical protein